MNYILIPFIVSFTLFALMWSGKLQGYGNFKPLKDFNSELHDFVRYAFAGLLTVTIFTFLQIDWSILTWQWALILLAGALSTWLGEKAGAGWVSGAIYNWNANYYWQEGEQDRWMQLPVFRQIIKLLPENMLGVFMVAGMRGLLWGLPFSLLLWIDTDYHKLILAWAFSLPASQAIAAGMQHSLTPEYGSWGRHEEIRWPLTLLIGVNL